MEYGAIDLHTKHSQIRIVTVDGAVVLERRIRTRADQVAAVFGGRDRMRIVLESSTESEWVATCLEELGHEVVVAEPNFAAMYGTRTRRITTDWAWGATALHAWVHRVAARRGRPIALVALARRLARCLYAMWRDGRDLDGTRVRMIAAPA